jgi:peptide/nickel transport system permease protein
LGSYLARRLAQAIIVVVGVTFVAFGVMYLTGDPVQILLGEFRGLSQDQVAEFRKEMGLDRPWIFQYTSFLSRLAHGDLGRSISHRLPNAVVISERLIPTLELGVTALLLNLVVAIPVGTLAASRRGTWVDHTTMSLTLIGQSMPVFWLGLMLMLVFAATLRWFPVSGRGDVFHLVLPAVTLAAFPLAQNARMVRSSVLDVLGQDYVRTARAKGMVELTILRRHVLRNAMIPVITLIGIQAGFLLGGAVITETIFAWPGIGRLMVQAIHTKDVPLVQACVVVLALIFVFLNLVVDLLYARLDPRIRWV